MIKEGKIGVQESICLMVITIGDKIFFATPGMVSRIVGTTGWLMTIVSNIVAIIAFTFICILLKRFPGKNIIEIFDISLGRVIGFIFSFIFAVFFLWVTSIISREFVDVLMIYVYPLSPIEFLTSGLIITVTIAAFIGLEGIARFAKLGAYVLLFAYIFLLTMSIGNYRVTNLFPIFGFGLGKTIINGIQRSSAYGEIIIVALFAGSFQGIKHIKKIGYCSLIITCIIISSALLTTSLTFPYFSSQEVLSPLFTMSRMISYGPFIQRLDPLFILLWCVASFVSITLFFYAAISSYCKSFRLQDTRPVIIPMAVLLFTLVLFPKDFTSILTYIQDIRNIGSFIFYGLPLIALIVAMIRKKKGANMNA